VVVGRDELENSVLLSFPGDHYVLNFPDVPGPVALVLGEVKEKDLRQAAELAARYSDAQEGSSVRVIAHRVGKVQEFWVTPWSKDDPRLQKLRVDR
jgi:predicted ribosome quality control (RQC) complex YloA/Tae2 family protein